jgi:hypothetical protein
MISSSAHTSILESVWLPPTGGSRGISAAWPPYNKARKRLRDQANSTLLSIRRPCSEFGQAVDRQLMKRALSILLMVVMVLAPCAVVHAASLGSPSHMTMSSDTSGSQNADCHAGKHDIGHEVCSGNCDTLPPVAKAGAAERSTIDLKASYTSLVLVLSFVFVILDDSEASANASLTCLESNSDSKTVLRQISRLRL